MGPMGVEMAFGTVWIVRRAEIGTRIMVVFGWKMLAYENIRPDFRG